MHQLDITFDFTDWTDGQIERLELVATTITDTPTWFWEMNDLCHFPIGRVLCVSAGAVFARFLMTDGLTLSDILVSTVPKSDYFVRSIRLRYTYHSRVQLLTDYRAGLLTFQPPLTP